MTGFIHLSFTEVTARTIDAYRKEGRPFKLQLSQYHSVQPGQTVRIVLWGNPFRRRWMQCLAVVIDVVDCGNSLTVKF